MGTVVTTPGVALAGIVTVSAVVVAFVTVTPAVDPLTFTIF